MENTNVINRQTISSEEFIRQCSMTHARNFRGNENKFLNSAIADTVLENKMLDSSEFNYSALKNIAFNNIDFSNSEFKFCELENVVFNQCKLDYTHFDYAQMADVKFVNCIMDNSKFDFASGEAVFEACALEGAEFHHMALAVTLNKCNCTSTEFNFSPSLEVNACDSNFYRAEFNDTTIKGSVKDSVFSRTDFDGANASLLKFENCSKRNLSVRGAVGVIESSEDDDDDDDIFDLDLD